VWHAERRLSKTQIPPGLCPWLFDNASLTQRLQQICHGRFAVRVLAQGWAQPMLNEARKLRIPTGKNAFIRQVHLCCDDKILVFARTIIPARTVRGRMRRLTHLGTRPLGEVLFNDPAVLRQELEIAKILPTHTLYKMALAHAHEHTQPIWGRRSIFTYHKRPLLVSEIFLPSKELGYDEPERHRRELSL
jgi:chorismate--pyruvate lyase